MSLSPKDSPERMMLAIRTFVMRGADRDKKVDRERIDRLVKAIDFAAQDVVAERNGLLARLKATVDQPVAASKKKLARYDCPTTTPAVEIRRAEKRLKRLTKQRHELEAARVRFLQWAHSDDSN